MSKQSNAITAILLVGASLNGCAASSSPWVEAKAARISVEIADDAEERARGLMFRDSLGNDHGMLFLFDNEQPLAFWMKNTKIPLDILYLDSQRRVVSIQRRVPPCSAGDRCPTYPSAQPALYVLELNAGKADSLGLQIGDAIEFSPDVPVKGLP